MPFLLSLYANLNFVVRNLITPLLNPYELFKGSDFIPASQ